VGWGQLANQTWLQLPTTLLLRQPQLLFIYFFFTAVNHLIMKNNIPINFMYQSHQLILYTIYWMVHNGATAVNEQVHIMDFKNEAKITNSIM
jgi:hypothetical protein